MSLISRIARPYLCTILTPNQCILSAQCRGTITAKRFLFSADKLGIENFKRSQAYHQEKIGDMKDKFNKQISELLEQKNPVVFTADLKAMIHMVTDVDELEMLTRMVRLYQTQHTDLSFVQFNFGPVLMRLLHLLNCPDKALQLYTDKEVSESALFDQMASQVVLIDLLFESSRYDDIHRVMDMISDKQLAGIKYPTDCLTLALATCLKQNTPESYQKMLSYIKGAKSTATSISHRGVVYAVVLAIKQEKYIEAMELVSLAPHVAGRKRQPLAIFNAKLLASTKVNRVEEVLLLLRSVLENDVPDHVRTGGEVFQDIMSDVKTAVISQNSKDLLQQYEALERGLREGNHIAEAQFESFIFRTIYNRKVYQDGYKHKEQTRREREPYAQGVRQT